MTMTRKGIIEEEIKAGIRKLVAEKGQPVKFEEPWYEGAEPTVSTYGWSDYPVWEHITDGCSWVVPMGVKVKELTYSQFDGTFTGNKDEVGLNAPGCHCKCGKHKDVTLRVTCSLGEAIQALIGYDTTKEMEL